MAVYESYPFYAPLSIGKDDDRFDIKDNPECISANKYYHDRTINNISIEGSNTKSLVMDIGCLKKISTIDIAWKNSNSVQYNFTLTILSDRWTIENMFSFQTDIIPSSNFQTAGLENTSGRIIILTINEPKNSEVADSIEKLSINTVQTEPKKITHPQVWNEISKKYFSNITIGNSYHSSVAELYRITDGDDMDVLNPNFSFAKTLDMTNSYSFFVRVPYQHIEGVTAKIDSVNPPYNLDSLNETLDLDDQSKIKSFYFILDKTKFNDTIKRENLTLMLATSSETSLYYKSKIGLDG